MEGPTATGTGSVNRISWDSVGQRGYLIEGERGREMYLF